jgi:hypothetical protein
MAKGKKTGGRDFEPGNKLGNGRPRVSEDLKRARYQNKVDFAKALNKLFKLDVAQLKDISHKDSAFPISEKIVAKILLSSFENSDPFKLQFVLDRLIGTPIIEPELPDDFEPESEKSGSSPTIGKKTFEEFCIKASYPKPFDKQDEMRRFAFDSDDTRILLGSRGYGKTDYVTILGVAYDIYLHGINTSNLIITDSRIRNTAIIDEIANALEANGMELEKKNSTCIRVKGLKGKQNSVEALTLGMSFRGRHPKRTLMDDPVSESNISAARRELVQRKYQEAYKLCKNICIIGQPVHADDLYANLRNVLKKMEVPHGQIPALDADLKAMAAANIDPHSIEMSYHLRVPVTGTMPFDKIKYIDKMIEGTGVAFIDPSDGGDYTAVSIVKGYMDGVAVVGRCWKRAWYHCTDEIVEFFKAHRVTEACFETNSTGRQPIEQLEQVLSPLGIGISGKHSDSNKHAVIMAAGGYAHLIRLAKESDPTYTKLVTKYEYGAEYDDAPDSLARCLEWIGLIRGRK